MSVHGRNYQVHPKLMTRDPSQSPRSYACQRLILALVHQGSERMTESDITPALRPVVHFVGSIPLADAAEVFRTVADVIGSRAPRIPDGETGERTLWVGSQVAMLAANPALEPVPENGEKATTAPGYSSEQITIRSRSSCTTWATRGPRSIPTRSLPG